MDINPFFIIAGSVFGILFLFVYLSILYRFATIRPNSIPEWLLYLGIVLSLGSFGFLFFDAEEAFSISATFAGVLLLITAPLSWAYTPQKNSLVFTRYFWAFAAGVKFIFGGEIIAIPFSIMYFIIPGTTFVLIILCVYNYISHGRIC